MPLVAKFLTPVFLKQFVKFCVVGATAALINFSFYYGLTSRLGLWYVYSAIFGFIISAIFNFLGNKFWTFQNNTGGQQALSQIFKFGVVMISGLIINTVIIFCLTDFVKVDYRLSWIVATGAVTFWSFGFNRLWTFKR